MAHIWRRLLVAKEEEKYPILKTEIAALYKYAMSEIDAKHYEEGAKALMIAVHLYYQVIVENPGHPNRNADMRAALDMLKEKIVLDVFILRKKFDAVEGAALEESEETESTQFFVEMATEELQQTYEKYKKNFTFPSRGTAKIWDQIAGLEEVKEWFLNSLAAPLIYKKGMNHMDECNGVLLYGPPGTGKSMIARSLASKIDLPFIEIQGSELMSKWHGESEQNIKKFFAMAACFSPCIVFIGKC